jgi:CRISPR-associated endonuclease Csn1
VGIDHILPYSRTLLNSRDNLTVAHIQCNQAKKNHTPFEAFGDSPGDFEWERILEVTAKLPLKKRNKFFPGAMDSFEKNNGYINKQLTDANFLALASKEYLSIICPPSSIVATPGKLTAMLRGFWAYNTLLNQGGDSWFKNESDHRHHALDALVIGLCDKDMLHKMADFNAGKDYAEIGAPERPIELDSIAAQLKEMVISHKSDHGKEGKLYAETAMAKRPYLEKISPDALADEKEIKRIVPKAIQEDIAQLVEKEGFKKAKSLLKPKYEYLRVFRDKWVTRSPLDSLSDRDIHNIADDTIRQRLQQFLDANPIQSGQKLQDVLAKFSGETGIHSVRYFPKDQVPLSINSCDNKAYMPGDFYRVDVWKVPVAKDKYKFEGVFISRPEVMMKKLQKRHEHPTAKLVMRLCKNDVILLSSGKTQEFCRVAGFATTRNKIDIRPLYASDSIAEWKKNTNIRLTSDYWPSDIEGQYFKSINVIFTEFEVKLIKITVDGRVIVRN